MKRRILTFSAAMLAAVLFAGCSGTRLISSWVAPAPQDVKLTKVMIVTVMGGKYSVYQPAVEKAVADQLKEAGVEATPAVDLFGTGVLNGMTEDQVMAKVKESGCKQVMMLSLVDKQKQLSYNPSSFAGAGPMYGPFWGNYMFNYSSVYDPGYYSVDTEYILSAQVFSIADNKNIYQATTDTQDPGSVDGMMKEVSDTIIKDMVKKGMIPGARK